MKLTKPQLEALMTIVRFKNTYRVKRTGAIDWTGCNPSPQLVRRLMDMGLVTTVDPNACVGVYQITLTDAGLAAIAKEGGK